MTPNPNPAQKVENMTGSDAVQCAGHTTPNQEVPDPASRSLPTSVTQGYMCLSDTAEVQGYMSMCLYLLLLMVSPLQKKHTKILGPDRLNC